VSIALLTFEIERNIDLGKIEKGGKKERESNHAEPRVFRRIRNVADLARAGQSPDQSIERRRSSAFYRVTRYIVAYPRICHEKIRADRRELRVRLHFDIVECRGIIVDCKNMSVLHFEYPTSEKATQECKVILPPGVSTWITRVRTVSITFDFSLENVENKII